MLTLALSALLSLAPGYRECRIASGAVFSCKGTSYTGSAIVKHDGLYRRCKISIGNVTQCGGSFTGTAPALDKGVWKTCKISTGHIFSCAANYHGVVVTKG